MKEKDRELLNFYRAGQEGEGPEGVPSWKNGIPELLRLALHDYIVACNMAQDPVLPACLREFCREITRVDSGAPYRPQLRLAVQRALKDRNFCKDLLGMMLSARKEEPVSSQRLAEFLVPLLKGLEHG